MRKNIINSKLIVLFLFTPLLFFGQNKDKIIENIRINFKKINQDKTYSILTLENEEFLGQMTDGGGELRGFFKNNSLIKIFERVGLSYCVTSFEYYFLNGKLIFVYEKEDDFPYNEKLGSLDYTKTDKVFEGRYYFNENKMIESKIIGEKRIQNEIDSNREKKGEMIFESAMDRYKLLVEKNK